MKLPQLYYGHKILGEKGIATEEMNQIKKIVAEDKANHGVIGLRRPVTSRFVDLSKGNPDAEIYVGVIMSYRKDGKNDSYLTYDEAYFIVDQNRNIHGRLSIEKEKLLRADLYFDAFKEGEIVDLGKNGVLSAYNIEETLHYTTKDTFTVFFNNIDVSEQKENSN